MKKFKGSLNRQFKEGTLDNNHVPFKTYRRRKGKEIKPPKTNWEKFIEWIRNFFERKS